MKRQKSYEYSTSPLVIDEKIHNKFLNKFFSGLICFSNLRIYKFSNPKKKMLIFLLITSFSQFGTCEVEAASD